MIQFFARSPSPTHNYTTCGCIDVREQSLVMLIIQLGRRPLGAEHCSDLQEHAGHFKGREGGMGRRMKKCSATARDVPQRALFRQNWPFFCIGTMRTSLMAKYLYCTSSSCNLWATWEGRDTQWSNRLIGQGGSGSSMESSRRLKRPQICCRVL